MNNNIYISYSFQDFFVDNHWDKLPQSWKHFLKNVSAQTLVTLLDPNAINYKEVWPLSLLSLKSAFKHLNINREMQYTTSSKLNPFLSNPKLQNIFKKHVKPKKRHEVQIMSEICSDTAKKCQVDYIVDFGAGLGHLSRKLAYGYQLKVCCLEQQTELTNQARFIDIQLEETATKYLKHLTHSSYQRPVHLNIKLSRTTNISEFICDLKSAFNIKSTESFRFGIVGLHPCGDLAAILLKIFYESSEAAFINLVGCCYMKLTTKSNDFNGYPLSNYLKQLQKTKDIHLTYESREIACHAIEMYIQKLRNDNYDDLKIHSYRAAIETIIVKYHPQLKRTGLRSVKHKDGLSFEDYCMAATRDLNLNLPNYEIDSNIIKEMLNEWKNVVIFYTLRLMFAPLVESVILKDRVLSVLENEYFCNIEAFFDPILSPRNHIMTVIKR